MMKKQNVRTIALIVVTFTYLLVGAAIFDALESEHEMTERDDLQQAEDFIRDKYNISEVDMDDLKLIILKSKPYRAGLQWKFSGSFYFSLSVITTIGYGHSTPRTDKGKMFCIVYALIGIPLNIVMFQSIGERFNIGITLVLRKFKNCLSLKNPAVTQTELTIVAVILCTAVLAGGALAFHTFENWKLLDAFYYCFITMSTIGFGDFVALQNTSMNALETKPDYVAFSIFYIIFGLTVFAAALNLMVLRLLTMNTEDERKDELEAIEAKRQAVKVDGDIITHETPDTTISPLGEDVEGIQIVATDTSANSEAFHFGNKLRELAKHSNGAVPISVVSRKPNIRRTGVVFSPHKPTTSIPETRANGVDRKPTPQTPRHRTTVEYETVLSSSSSRLKQKRGSV